MARIDLRVKSGLPSDNTSSLFGKSRTTKKTYTKEFQAQLDPWDPSENDIYFKTRDQFTRFPFAIGEDRTDDFKINVKDLKIDEEIERGDHEDETIWDALTASSTGGNFDFDYIIASDQTNSQLLVKWTNYPIPTWTGKSNVCVLSCDPIKAFNFREETNKMLVARLRTEYGDAFDEAFPNRFLPVEHSYVYHPRSRYINKIRGREWRWNLTYLLAGMVEDHEKRLLLIEDWTDMKEDIPSFKFTAWNLTSPAVREILEKNKQLADLRCLSKCSAECSYPREHFTDIHDKRACCGIISQMNCHYNGGRLENRLEDLDGGEDTPLTVLENTRTMVVECTAACECGLACGQRVVQKGRQIPLIIFREKNKNWGLRTAKEIPAKAFVVEYTGEVLTTKECENRSDSIYQFEMRYSMMDLKTGKKHLPLVVDAKLVGNEARFINHSCLPNLSCVPVLVERYGTFFHRFAFFARRKILAGEELTFDYYPNGRPDTEEPMFKECYCGHGVRCKFSPDHAKDSAEDDAELNEIADPSTITEKDMEDNPQIEAKSGLLKFL